MMKNYRIIVALILITLMSPFSTLAQEKISVAVASNFISAFKAIAADFEAQTGVKVEATYSSTGNLYSQIKNGAPYDIFLSADEERPALLQKEGLTEGTFVYARGQVILWSANKAFCKSATWQDALRNDKVKKIAIANPLTAPYGAAAKTALQKAGLWNALQSRIVNAQDIAQSFQYAATVAVDACFCSMSAVSTAQGQSGCFFVVPEAPVIIQFGCVLKSSKNPISAELLVAYLISNQPAKIKMKYGYR
jgi:molybdate transport system substrate-binding protein